jgi:hypothetical protein
MLTDSTKQLEEVKLFFEATVAFGINRQFIFEFKQTSSIVKYN